MPKHSFVYCPPECPSPPMRLRLLSLFIRAGRLRCRLPEPGFRAFSMLSMSSNAAYAAFCTSNERAAVSELLTVEILLSCLCIGAISGVIKSCTLLPLEVPGLLSRELEAGRSSEPVALLLSPSAPYASTRPSAPNAAADGGLEARRAGINLRVGLPRPGCSVPSDVDGLDEQLTCRPTASIGASPLRLPDPDGDIPSTKSSRVAAEWNLSVELLLWWPLGDVSSL
mmetsp:Transcript_20061/g.46724  ORF Transcript_20061/g.46724 Transcript_20061/m.46724 type:complete len:226 (+) Transcript_20061:858-1535(+)